MLAPLLGALSGPYLVLMKWYPGYMSAPAHTRPTAFRSFFPAHGG